MTADEELEKAQKELKKVVEEANARGIDVDYDAVVKEIYENAEKHFAGLNKKVEESREEAAERQIGQKLDMLNLLTALNLMNRNS
ncbi:MAG: hypothetical protein IKX40_12720 [Thermoguttaceae bacterium]|nr:hypothetical protein [Thermoguttaceae bacterium]